MIYIAISASLVIFSRAFLSQNYSPGRVWAYTWAFAWACQAVFGAGFLLNAGTVAFIATCNFVFLIGTYIACAGRTSSEAVHQVRKPLRDLQFGSTVRSLASAVSILSGFVALNIGLKQAGSLGLVSALSGSFVDFGTSLVETKATMHEEGAPTAITIAAVCLTCAAVLLGIEFALFRRERRRTLFFLVLGLVALATAATAGTGVRGYMLIAILLFSAAYLSTKVLLVGEGVRMPARVYVTAMVGIFIFLVWTVIVQSARRSDFSFARVGDTLDYLRAWFAGYMPALSQWSSSVEFESYGFNSHFPGSNLLAGVLGPLEIVQGEGFNEQVNVIAIGDGATSNAMTVFRVLLLDFGYPGSLLACAIAGFAAQRIYIRVLGGSVLAIVPLAAVYAAILFSMNYWFFARGSRIGGVVIAFAVVALSQKLRSPSRRAMEKVAASGD